MGNLYKSLLFPGLFFLITLVSFSFFATDALAVNRLNVTTSGVVQISKNIVIAGSDTNTTTSDSISSVNNTAIINGTSQGNYSITPANGTFYFNVTAPSVVGPYNITVYTNHSTPLIKYFPIFVSNATTGTITFVRSFPPFSASSTFTVNITLKNYTIPVNNISGTTFSYNPAVSVYLSDGTNTSWTIVNNSVGTDVDGTAIYNITIPSTAATGSYVILVDEGVISTVFEVSSGYRVAVNTLDTSDAITSNFAPSSTVNIFAKIRDTNGNPVTGATVNASITNPAGTVSTIVLSAHPSSEGFYNNTFSSTSLTGNYEIRISATVSGNTIESTGIFSVRTFTARIEPHKKFFFEWGGQGAFKPNSTIALDIISNNLTDSAIINWGSCTTANYTWVDLSLVNGTSINSSVANVAYVTDPLFSGTSVCRVSFNLPTLSLSGIYRLRVNVTVANSNETAEGFFAIQKYFLKPVAVFSLGGSQDFMQVVAPGDNVTIVLKAYNVTNGDALLPQNLSVFNVTQLIPLEFKGGSSEVTNFNQSSVAGSNPTTDPKILLQLPSNILGPLLIQVRAQVPGETITGNVFIVSNYLMGFMSPRSAGIMFGGGMGGDAGGGPGGPGARCSGTQTFSGTVQDVKTSTVAQGATVIGIIQAREEETGKSVNSFLSIASATASDSTGSISANITFSPSGGYSFNGNYFMVFNVSYKGNTAGLPAFFQCKNLQIGFPQIQTIGSNQQNSWQVSPTSGVNVTLSNVTNMTGSLINNQSYVTIDKIFNFNPSAGSMQILIPNNPTGMRVNFTTRVLNENTGAIGSNIVALAVYPQNFTLSGINLTQWPNGFFDLRPKVVSSLGTDSGFGGFMVTAFNVFPENFGFGQVSAGSVQTLTVNANTNVSAFQISLGRPWEGELVNVTPVTATPLSDGWNHSANTSFERWQLTYTIPGTTKKGGQMLTVLIFSNASDNNGNSVDLPLFQTVTKFSVLVPAEDQLGSQTSQFDSISIPSSQATALGFNLTFINETFRINSTSNQVCVKQQFNVTRNNQAVSYNPTTRVLAMDAGTSGSYNLLIFNNSQGNLTFANYSVITQNTTLTNVIANITGYPIFGGRASRNITVPSVTGALYYLGSEFCGFHRLVNTTNSTFQAAPGAPLISAGVAPSAVNTEFIIPYTVLLGGIAQQGFTVDVNGMGKQDNRGFGFEARMTGVTGSFTNVSGIQYNFSSVSDMTDAAGTAFVKVNVSNSGKLVAFWRANSSSDSDFGDMMTATFLQIQAFRTLSGPISSAPSALVKLYFNSTNATDPVFPTAWHVFNGTLIESSDADFITNSRLDTWYFTYNNNTNQTLLANNTGASAYNPSNVVTINSTISPGTAQGAPSGTNLAIAEITSRYYNNNNNTLSNVTFHFFNNNQLSNQVNPASTTANISVRICAENFAKPTANPVEGASVNLSVTDWSTFPATTKYLDMYRLSDNSSINPANPIRTGPRGCVALWVGPGQLVTWPSSGSGRPPIFVEGTLTQGTNTEFVYIMDIFKY